MLTRLLGQRVVVGATALVASAVVAAGSGSAVAATGQVRAPGSGATGSPAETSRYLQIFASDIKSTTPEEAVAQINAEDTRLDSCAPAVVKAMAAQPLDTHKVLNPTKPSTLPTRAQERGASVIRDIYAFLVAGAQVRGEVWNTTAFKAFLTATEHVPNPRDRTPARFVRQSIDPLLSLNFCSVFSAWNAKGLKFSALPMKLYDAVQKEGELSEYALIGRGLDQGITDWGASASVTATWEAEVRKALAQEVPLSRQAGDRFVAWLKSTGIAAQLKRAHIDL